MTRTLLHNGVVHVGRNGASATAMAVEDDRVVWVGNGDRSAAYDGADEVVDLAGRLVTPAFVDAHIHLVQTGQQLTGLDLTDAATVRATHGSALQDGSQRTTWPTERRNARHATAPSHLRSPARRAVARGHGPAQAPPAHQTNAGLETSAP